MRENIMQLKQHICLMAEYNQWMNQKLYEVASTLSEELLAENKGAFFGSIIGTLNHIMVGDIAWLKRFALHLSTHQELNPIRELAQPKALDIIIHDNFSDLKASRVLLDDIFTKFANSLTEAELSESVSYRNMKGVASTKNLFSLMMHVFNHQTHHRGQISTLLSQSGVDIGVTDLAVIIPNA
jgi:uncharacterized damage-inducible protein DinB